MVGLKFDQEKPDYSLLPFGALDEVVKVLTYGANKYDRFNWEFVEDNRYQAAALRHISAYMQGELDDPESGYTHLAHAVCNLLFLMSKVDKAEELEYNSGIEIDFSYDQGQIDMIDLNYAGDKSL